MRQPKPKLGRPLSTRVEEFIEERLRDEAEKHRRTVAEIIRIMVTADINRRDKAKHAKKAKKATTP